MICLITLDRFIVLRFPLTQVRFRRRSAIVACSLVWILGLCYQGLTRKLWMKYRNIVSVTFYYQSCYKIVIRDTLQSNNTNWTNKTYTQNISIWFQNENTKYDKLSYHTFCLTRIIVHCNYEHSTQRIIIHIVTLLYSVSIKI